ncbi:MAG: putative baseplate assembly protein [Candidatus Korobacteraceae bacterium]
MKLPCGCCAGVQSVTPEAEQNRPGLAAISYRVGTYATFFESMIARLSSLYLDVPAIDGSGTSARLYPLKQLTTRDPADPAIALLDAWAIVADVLTFYQERIANEGYLPTAVERRSLVELARLIGYKPRPGVSASVYLAFTVVSGFQGVISAGARAQSIPGAGQTAQFFETSDDLSARDVWNSLGPRLTRPQVLTHVVSETAQFIAIDEGTDASTRETVYFSGTSTNLKVGDGVMFVAGEGQGQQIMRIIASLNAQAAANRTEVVLQEALPSFNGGSLDAITAAFQPFIDEAATIFSDVTAAADVSTALQDALGQISEQSSQDDVLNIVSPLVSVVVEKHDVAVKRGFTRLEPWLAQLLDVLNDLVTLLSQPHDTRKGELPPPLQLSFAPAGLSRLTAILGRLNAAPSLQPANSQRLARTLQTSFSAHSDVAPRLLEAFYPRAKSTLYQAWAGTETPGTEVTVNALRAKASLFASSYAGVVEQTKNDDGSISASIPTLPSLSTTWEDLLNPTAATAPSAVALDAVYDQIKPGSWIAVDRLLSNGTRKVTYHQVQSVQTRSMDTQTGFTAKSSVLTVAPLWLSDSTSLGDELGSTPTLRGTIVYAQAEPLDLAEEPLDVDVHGNSIELDGLYDGIEPGRWIIVSGERTDIPNTTGVTASELVMISAVTQGAGKQSCLPFNTNTVVFSSALGVTAANDDGDRLLIGVPNPGLQALLQQVPLPDSPRQQVCDALQIAPGLWVNAYVPTSDERNGIFTSFAALIPKDLQGDFANGVIPPTRLDSVFAWRFSDVASRADTVHTTVQLANDLSYTYGATKVTIYANVVKATHGQTIGEVLGDGDASQPFETFALHQQPLTYVSAATPAGAQSTLLLRVNELEWHEADNIADLGPTDRGYTTLTDDDDQTSVIFGTGDHGARVPTGTANVKATYRYGIGAAGNVDAMQISQLATHPLGAQGVINPLEASGGADRDTIDQARRNAPLAVEALDRLVSVDDYEKFARTYAGIGKASAMRLSDGRRQLVHLTIAGVGDIPIDQNSDLYLNLIQSLMLFGDPHQPLQVCLRTVRLLVIIAGVQIDPDYEWEIVEANMRAALLDTFSFDNRDLGQSAFLSEAIGVMQNIAGVTYVNVQNFGSVAQDVTAQDLASLTTTIGLAPHVQAQLARLNPAADSSATDPCQRILPAEVAYLTSDIPATLILNQISAQKA